MIQISGGAVTASQLPGAAVPMLPEDHGLIGWSCPIDYATQQSLLSVAAAAGTLRLTRIRRLPATSITNLHIFITVAGATLSNCYAGLYTAAGTLVAQTADQSTAWQSVGAKTMALTGGPYSLAAGDYYVGFWYNGTTAPTVQRSGIGTLNTQINLGQSSGNFNASDANTGLTTTAPGTIGTQTASVLHWWVAVS